MLIEIHESSCCFMLARTSIISKSTSASFYCAMCQYCWLGMLCGVISQHTFNPLMKVEERHRVSEHQRQPGTSLHCTRASTSANWFSSAGTCPRHKTTSASLNRTVKSAYCFNLLSHQISNWAFVGWHATKLQQDHAAKHQRGSSRDSPTQKPDL